MSGAGSRHGTYVVLAVVLLGLATASLPAVAHAAPSRALPHRTIHVGPHTPSRPMAACRSPAGSTRSDPSLGRTITMSTGQRAAVMQADCAVLAAHPPRPPPLTARGD